MGVEKQETDTTAVTSEEVATETQSDFDMEAATAEISSELFGQVGEEEKAKTTEGQEVSGEASTDAPPAQPPAEEKPVEETPAAEENSEEVQAIGAPKTWTKEALEKWATLDPVVQKEIAKREEDFLNGITQYKAAADLGIQYSKVVEPYAPILTAEKVDPVQLFQSFAANHYLLSRGTPEQKIELAATLLNSYNIPLAELLNFMADGPEQEDPKIVALRKEIDELKGTVTSRQTAENEAVRTRIASEIDAFAKDPAHPHFDELADDIQKLFAAGLAANLQEAYDKALFGRPELRQKELDRLTAEKLAAAETEANRLKTKVQTSTADHVVTTPKQRDGTVPKGSMDDTLSETLAAIQNRA